MESSKDEQLDKVTTGAETNRVDDISKGSGIGSMSSALTDSLRGISHLGTGSAAPINKDSYGLTFFTRPGLNLTFDNVHASRILSPLAADTKDPTIWEYVRAALDHRIAREERGSTPLFDNRTAFIPLLTNNLLSLNGWPDMTVDTYTSQEGIYKEAYSLVDGVARNFSTFDLTANFRNISGDPITLLFMVWIHYAARVYEGTMMPYPKYIVENRVDYNTRIYRLVLDSTRTHVQKIAACGAAFPMATPMGAAFNFNSEKPLNTENEQVSIPFRCMGVDYMDPVLVDEFNATGAIFNPELVGTGYGKTYKPNGAYVKLKKAEKNYFKYSGFPRINEDTWELEWWLPADEYKKLEE